MCHQCLIRLIILLKFLQQNLVIQKTAKEFKYNLLKTTSINKNLYFKSIQAICESFEKSNYKKELLNQIALNANRRKYKEDNKIDRIQR